MEKLIKFVHENSPLDIKLEAAKVLVEAAKVEEMIEQTEALQDLTNTVAQRGYSPHLNRSI